MPVGSDRDRLLARVRHILARYVEPARFGASVPLELAVHRLAGEPVGYEEAIAGPWAAFACGDRWGGAWGTTWFRGRAVVPEAWAGERVDFRFDLGYRGTPGFGAEGLLWRDGAPLAGVNSRHQEVMLAHPAKGGEAVEVYLEAAANPQAGGEDMLTPEYEGQDLFALERAELAVHNLEVEALYADMVVLAELAHDLPADGARTGEILAALRRACALVETDEVAASASEARAALADVLARPAAASAHRVFAVGHAHIDSAWLWPVRETVRKCARTFSTALGLLERYPDYHFVCSQAQQHAWVKEHYPELFTRMQEMAAKGGLEPVGSMWVEADCNLPSGESLVRQFLYGKGFFLDHYGVETTDCWLPDAFGFPASFPQILVQAGIHGFITQKLSWSEMDRYPHHSFWWEGIDGTRVLAHFPPSDTYNGDFSVRELRLGARNFADHDRSGASVYPFGHGDGGGGPTEEMLERAARVADLDGVPRVEMAPVRSFLARLEGEGERLASWVGELYLELHRGTYTTQARTKAGNRRGEVALYEAELWSTISGMASTRATRRSLDEAWRTLLLNQFHDILPGSGINWVAREAEADHAKVLETAGGIARSAREQLAASVERSWASRPLVVTNAASHDRQEVVALPALVTEGAETPALVDATGRAWPLQRAEDGRWLAFVSVPSCGWVTYDLAVSSTVGVGGDSVAAGPGWIENARLRVEIDGEGLLASLYDKVAHRQVLAPGLRGNALWLYDDQPAKWDAWDIDEFYADRGHVLREVASVEVVEEGPLRAGIRVRRRFGSSTVSQVVRLAAGSGRLDFETEVDWHERHRLLKTAFPVAVRAAHATYEIQFGAVERPTHANTSWDRARFEVCAHRWADLSEPGYGVALLNDSKYGYHIWGNVMELSLLRSPTSPDPVADQGWHRFTYSLLPHAGDLVSGSVVDAGIDLNVPLEVTAVPGGISQGGRPARFSSLRFDRPGVVLSALKPAESGDGLVLRFYEAHGSRGPVGIDLALPVARANRADLLEREGESVDLLSTDAGTHLDIDLRPFEIVTLVLHTS
jgi:alpha-mannosidase